MLDQVEQVLREGLAAGVSLRRFMEEYVPRIHAARGEEFSHVSDVPLVLSVWFRDTDERYTVELSGAGCVVERGEMVDFPVATIAGLASGWETFKPQLLRASLALEEGRERLRSKYGQRRVTPQVKRVFEGLEGVIEVVVDGAPLWVILNDYEGDGGGKGIKVSLSESVVLSMARGEVEPRQVSGSVKVSGQMGFALELAGFFSTHFGV